MKRPTFVRIMSLLFCLAPLVGASDVLAERSRFYMVMFGSEGNPSTARSSHTFATFLRTDGGRVTEELTISWLPAPGYFGPGYTMPPLAVVPGRNYTLDETIARSPGRRTVFEGPFEISPALYQRAASRVAFLSRGLTSYKMIVLRDRLRAPALANQPGGAINCIMAVSDLGGHLDTGTAWGWDASSKVLAFLQGQILWPRQVDHNVAAQINLVQRLSPRW